LLGTFSQSWRVNWCKVGVTAEEQMN